MSKGREDENNLFSKYLSTITSDEVHQRTWLNFYMLGFDKGFEEWKKINCTGPRLATVNGERVDHE